MIVCKIFFQNSRIRHQMNDTTQRFDYLNYWRGIAILLVILTHTTHHNMSGDVGIKIIDDLFYFGHHGVTLFFIISSFTIFYSIHSKLGSENNSFWKFNTRRFFRIAPLYYLGIIIYYFGLFGHREITKDVLLNVVFLNWLSPSSIESVVPGGWSITTEFTFYFFAPLLFKKIKTLQCGIRYFLIFILLSRILLFVLHKIYVLPPEQSYYYSLNPIAQFPVFFIGIILYFVIVKKESFKLDLINIVLIACVIFINGMLTFVITDYLLYAIMFGLMLFYSSKKNFLHPKIVAFLNYVGEISFTLYITHFLIINTLLKLNLVNMTANPLLDWILRLSLTLVGSILISIPIHHFIELPFIRIGKNLIDGRFKKRRIAIGYAYSES